MPKPKIKILWSDGAKADLLHIFNWVKEASGSLEVAINIRNSIIQRSKEIHFVEQYQTDEYLGEPFRRMIVHHYKIIYKPQNNLQIRILKIFGTRQDPKKLK